MCPKIKGEPLAPDKTNRTNAIARRTAIKLLALCCPGQMPESSLITQVPALETQYRNAEKTLKFFPMGGGGDLGSDSSDSGDASDESDDSTTQESNADSDGSEEAGPIIGGGGEGAAPTGAEIFDPFDDYWKTKAKHKAAPDPMEAVAGAAAQVKHAHDLATGTRKPSPQRSRPAKPFAKCWRVNFDQ